MRDLAEGLNYLQVGATLLRKAEVADIFYAGHDGLSVVRRIAHVVPPALKID